MKKHISQRKFIRGAAGGAVGASALASGQTANEQKTSSVKRGSDRCRRGSRTEGDKDTIGQFPSLPGVYHPRSSVSPTAAASARYWRP